MRKPRRLLFVLTDGGRARLVEKSPETGHFVTVEEFDHTEQLRTLRKELRASPSPRSFSSASPRRSAMGQEDYYRPAKEAFVAEVAARAVALAKSGALDGVFVAAPARLIGPLKAKLEGQATVAGSLRKDLTKTPDHALGAWLNGALTGQTYST